MNIFNKAAKVCRSASRSLRAPFRALSRQSLNHALDKTLETVACVLCVQSSGVMVCGPAGVSVAHFPSPKFSAPQSTL